MVLALAGMLQELGKTLYTVHMYLCTYVCLLDPETQIKVQSSKFIALLSNRHECTQLCYTEWNENNKLEITRKSKNWVFKVLSVQQSGEGLAYDQTFCICDVWVNRSGAVLTSVIKNRYGKVSDQHPDICWCVVWQWIATELTFREISKKLNISVGTAYNIFEESPLLSQTEKVRGSFLAGDHNMKSSLLLVCF